MKAKHGITTAVLLLGATFLAYAIWGPKERERTGVRSLRTAQEADAPDGEPREFPGGWAVPPYDHRLEMLSGVDRFRVPLASRLDYPLGTRHGGFVYNAQAFWESNNQRGGRHTGDDLNGIGGRNSDLGDPVYAIGNGLVIYAGEPDPSWGQTLVLAHRLSDGRIVQSMYSHLQHISAPLDDQVSRGQLIGRVGQADGRYLAHLHFELHHASGPSLGAGYVTHRTNRLDPAGTVRRHRGADEDSLAPSTSEIVAKIARDNLVIPLTTPNKREN